MKIDMRLLNDIKPYEKNPRINDKAVEAVSRSIQEFGFRHPIVVGEDGVIDRESVVLGKSLILEGSRRV